MPKADSPDSLVPPDYTAKSLASMFLDIIAEDSPKTGPLKLRTFAIGAPIYTDVKMGAVHLDNEESGHEWRRLRIYRAVYPKGHLGNYNSPEPQLVAKSVCDDAKGICEDLSIFRPYWLG